MKNLQKIFFIIFLLNFLWPFSSIHAANIATESSTVSATVPEQSFNPPVLINPPNNSSINTTRPTFSWNRPDPVPSTPLHHYDLYIDDQVFAASVSDSGTSQEYYFYNTSSSNGVFYVYLKTDLSQGYHTWKVVAYNDAGLSATSETWTFYIDSVYPYISVTTVDHTTLNWSTQNPSSIPPANERYIIVSTHNPLLTGTVEPNSNIKFLLICPQNIPSCQNQVWQGNNSSGNWEHRLYGLIPNAVYTMQISATDASGNSIFFPDFYISYGAPTTTPTSQLTPTTFPSSTITPTVTTFLPFPTGSITPPPGLLVPVSVSPVPPTAPPAPTPPPPEIPPQEEKNFLNLFYSFLIILIIMGLPTHLLMSILGTSTPISFIPRFLFILCYPFFTNKTHQTIPFSFISLFNPDQLNKPWQKVISDINGFYGLKSPLPESIFIKLISRGRTWKDNLFKGSLLSQICLHPTIKLPITNKEKLLRRVYKLRSIPLVVACLTSITTFIIFPSYWILIYIYFSLQYAFSEYLYPRI